MPRTARTNRTAADPFARAQFFRMKARQARIRGASAECVERLEALAARWMRKYENAALDGIVEKIGREIDFCLDD